MTHEIEQKKRLTAQEPKMVLHERNGVYEFYGKFKKFESIDECYYRYHKSYLINLDKKSYNRIPQVSILGIIIIKTKKCKSLE
nr:LytTR family transcriptional regulator DNA-binding domain-containing protein [Bacillus sp. JCM 19034]